MGVAMCNERESGTWYSMQIIRNSVYSLALAISLVAVQMAVGGMALVATLGAAQSAVVSAISVRGNQRVDADTIRSYVTVKPGRRFSNFEIDKSLKQLFGTGLFADVQVFQASRVLVVKVVENPTVNVVIFKGNSRRMKDDRLKSITQLSGRSIFTEDKLESDVARIREAYRRTGRSAASVEGRVVRLDNNRVNVVFDIAEGDRTKIAEINFVGNNAYSDRRLTDVLSINESNFLSWLRKDDIYDRDKMRADEEKLRRFYFNRGYADFHIISTTADLDEVKNQYIVTITVEEGDRYRFGEVTIENSLPNIDTDGLYRTLKSKSGKVYSAKSIEKTLVGMTTKIAKGGYAFAEVSPRGDRNYADRTISIVYYVDEGPRVYVEAIEIRGNTRTRGYVIRREFDISEGDAYNRVMIQKAKQRLDRLGFFKSVNITTGAGSSPDRIVVYVDVIDNPTGEFSIGGGYSTDQGAIAEISFSEKNFLGRGQFIRIAGGLGEQDTKYELSFTEPYFLGRRIAAGFDLSRQESNAANSVIYDRETTLGRIRFAAPLTEYVSIQTAYSYKIDNYSISPGAVTSPALIPVYGPGGDQVTSAINYELKYNTIDNAKIPHEGIYAVWSQEYAGLGGDFEYLKTEAKATGYYTLSEELDLVGMLQLTGGYVENFNDRRSYFFKSRFIRGFAPYGLGPRDIQTGEPLGGDTYASATVELQFPLPVLSQSLGLRGAIFAEAGTLYGNDFSGAFGGTAAENAASAATLNNDALRASVGASIIWDSPFGPLRVDLSHAFLKESYDRTQLFRFGVSTKF